MSRFDCPYLIAPAFWWAVFQAISSFNVFTGAAAPSDASHLLKSRFIPYFRSTEHRSSLPRPSLTPEHWPHTRKLFAGSLSVMLGLSAASLTVLAIGPAVS